MFELKKIGFIRRASALLLDAILLAVLATGFMWIIDLISNFRGAWKTAGADWDAWEAFRTEYVQDVADHYGYTYVAGDTISEDTVTIEVDGQAQTSQVDVLIQTLLDDENRNERMEEAYQAYKALKPFSVVGAESKYAVALLSVLISIGVLLAYIILEFIIPIILKNGQTVGKKIFSICLVRPNCVKIPIIALFARTILGKYAIETMFPLLLVYLFIFSGLGITAIVLFAAMVLLNVILFFATKNRTPIHDIVSNTVAVDMKIQMIFASEEELAAKKAEHKEFLPNSKN